ncbi:hypothetical protein E1B28_010543 [Marasmius oreades]|uniref:Uncharacterized protein n=1 Tax=Marasmius oreades TaxID=181124 RepID=A0A9P7RXH1_9AGAR|nr:uncharacterized protein E1B28_010543 [Marasmius oreades]KAG7091515.1 hypothetical protein E1B28_010543 [Marasmius oreades]
MSSTPTPTTTRTAESSDRRLLITGLTLGLIGLIAVFIIIYWTLRLKIPQSIPTLADPESLPTRRSSPKSALNSSSSSSSKGGNLVRKATTTLSSFSNNLNTRHNKLNFPAKITPFGSSNDDQHSQKPKFIHIPGQNMRIATRLPNGAWTFSEPDVRTNRRSMAWSTFDGGGSGRQSGFGFGSTSGTGYRGIDASSVSQVSPTSSTFFSHKPRFLGGPGIAAAAGSGLAVESSLSVNTQGLPVSSLSSPSPYSADSHSTSPLIPHYDLGLGPVTCASNENPFDSPVTEQMQMKEKEEEAQYGFQEPEAPPPAYTEERYRVRERDGWV